MPDVLLVFAEADATPVNGVVVRAFDSDGAFVTSVTSGAVEDGEAIFTAAEGEYTVRFSMGVAGYVIPSPLAVTVVAAAEGSLTENTFDVVVTLPALPPASDPLYCRCSGYFRNMDGTPLVAAELAIENLSRPTLLENSVISQNRLQLRTDSRGYVSVDLVRGGIYRTEMPGLPDISLEFRVPDLSAANLPDVLLPVLIGAVFTPGTLSVEVGETGTVDVEALYRSGLKASPADYLFRMTFITDDAEVATVELKDGILSITGTGAGTAKITPLATVRPADVLEVLVVPDIGVLTGELTVTVTAP